ncbi:nucleotidyltransferase family protein [Okeania sp. SIO1I7]|uniref:nucleotidyltransferase domain-containing protein n=1 Tax=Okeania sp. SIO1I7 TaxID=2607772 RepID=UPI0013F9887A|nr:nucleotidyltransferase family protein [Okeania sp. SIO1I7]NET24091.1 nucleotidyltransferase family protein [Okeania sp. SIO1I7]
MKKNRPENELLLCCARTYLDAKNSEKLKNLLQKDIDWEYLIEIANLEGVIPLLYWNLNTICPESVPQATLSKLKDNFYATTSYNLTLTSELLKLLELFETNDIPAIPFKGAVLAASVYGNLGFRQWGDLDILIRKQDILKAKVLLLAEGYETPTQTLAKESKLLKFHYNYKFYKFNDEKNIFLELHWKIATKHINVGGGMIPFDIDIEPFWQRLELVELSGKKVLHFPPEDLIVILCIHGSKDRWRQLKWLCDLAQLIYVHPEMDWEMVIETSKNLGIKKFLFLALLLINELWGVSFPEAIGQKIQKADPVVKLLVSQVSKRFLFTPGTPTTKLEHFLFRFLSSAPHSILHFFLLYTRSFRRRIRKARNIIYFSVVPSGKDQEFLPLPKSLSFLYYFVRPIRIIAQKDEFSKLKKFIQRMVVVNK